MQTLLADQWTEKKTCQKKNLRAIPDERVGRTQEPANGEKGGKILPPSMMKPGNENFKL